MMKGESYLIVDLLHSCEHFDHYKATLLQKPDEYLLLKLFKTQEDYSTELEIIKCLRSIKSVLKVVANHKLSNESNNYSILYKYPVSYTLEHYLKSNTLTESQLKNMCFQIITALIYVHNKRIIHSNINMKSIYVGSKNQFYLGDFHKAEQLKENCNQRSFCNDFRLFGKLIKDIILEILPNANFNYQNSEVLSFAVNESHLGYNWKYLIKRMTHNHPVLQCSFKETLLFLAADNKELMDYCKNLYGKDIAEYFKLNDIESLVMRLFNKEEDSFDLILLQKLVFLVGTNIKNINILGIHLRKVNFENNFYYSLKLGLTVLLLFTSEIPFINNTDILFWKIFNEVWERFKEHYHQSKSYDDSNIIIKLIQAIEFKKVVPLNLGIEISWSNFSSYLKRLHENFSLIESNMSKIKTLSALFFAIVKSELDSARTYFNYFKNILKNKAEELTKLETLEKTTYFIFDRDYEISERIEKKINAVPEIREVDAIADLNQIPNNEDIFINKLVLTSSTFSLYSGQYLNKIVIIKSFKTSHNLLFSNEVSMINLVNCKEILKPLFISDKSYQLVFKYYRIGSLKELIKSPVLNFKLKINIVVEIVKAMNYLHNANIIHRELTPSSIIIKRIENNKPKIKIFNLHSAILDSDSNPPHQPDQPRYSSPEMQAKHKYSLKTDIYSFGVILCDLYTTKYIYKKEDLCESKQKILNENNPPDTSLISSNKIKEIAEICLQHDPNRRHSFEQILNNLI